MRKCMDEPDLVNFDFDAEPRNARVHSCIRKAFNATPWKDGFVVATSNGLVLALTPELCIARAALRNHDADIYSCTPHGHIVKVIG